MISKGGGGGEEPAAMVGRPCPFCPGQCIDGRCPQCGRDPTARRKVCGACARMTPTLEPVCCHCKAKQSGGTAKTVVTIILVIVILNVVGIAIRLAIG